MEETVKKNKRLSLQIAILIFLLVILSTCTKRIYLGNEDALLYKNLYDECRGKEEICHALLKGCFEEGGLLLNCP